VGVARRVLFFTGGLEVDDKEEIDVLDVVPLQQA